MQHKPISHLLMIGSVILHHHSMWQDRPLGRSLLACCRSSSVRSEHRLLYPLYNGVEGIGVNDCW